MTRPWQAVVVALLVGLAVVLALSGCGDRSSSPAAGTFTPQQPGVLTVVTSDVPQAGFWEGTPTHLIGGFEYELARDLVRRFGLRTVRVEIESFHRVVVGHLGAADMALDLVTPTAQRARFLSFSSPYLDAAPTVLVRTGTSVADLETARSLTWGTIVGSTLVGIINRLVTPAAPVKTYENDSLLLGALEAHRVDAVLLDMPAAVVIANRSHGRLQAAAQLPQSETIAAALPRNSGNVQAVDSAIRAFTADGTINHLLRTWIGPSAANAEKSIPLLRTTR
ncbi:MAG: transporter substrate-binding domain-containing protein [Solirubrobacteraceae bacterium]